MDRVFAKRSCYSKVCMLRRIYFCCALSSEMSPQVSKVLRILTWTTLLLRCSTFNLKATEDMATFLVSPIVHILGVTNASNQVTQLPSNVAPSYYGYSLNLFNSQTGAVGFKIGSPKLIDSSNPELQVTTGARTQEPKGSISLCVVDANATFFTERSLTCYRSTPPSPQRGDNFGLSIPVRPDGNTLACSTTRSQDCSTVRYNPGSCFKSSDFGQTWNSTRVTKELSCPVFNVEVLFVLDGSKSVGLENFAIVKNWVREISRKIGLEKERVTVGVVQYSHYYASEPIYRQSYIVTEIKVGKYREFASFAAAVDNITLHGYTTDTGRALQKVLTDFNTTANYGKQTTKQVMILLTDGKATDPDLVQPNAEILRSIGVITYAVGVGSQEDIDRKELRLIANGDPNSDTRVYTTADFSGLNVIAKELEVEIEQMVLEGQGGLLNSTGFKMQFGQTGFSISYSKAGPNRVGADESPYGVIVCVRNRTSRE